MTKAKNPAVYVVAGVTKRAARSSGIPQLEIAARGGMSQPRWSMLLAGKRFGETVRTRVEIIARTLGVAPAVRRIGQKRKAS